MLIKEKLTSPFGLWLLAFVLLFICIISITGTIKDNTAAKNRALDTTATSSIATTTFVGNLAFTKTVTQSSIEAADFYGSQAVDGDAATRWASAEGLNAAEWLCVDLGSLQSINQVVINWETAYAKAYKVQVSTDCANFTDVVSVTDGAGGMDSRTFTATKARYVRIYCTAKVKSTYGYSIYELEVYASATDLF